MATVTVSKVIDELTPESERGILLNRMIESMGAAEVQVAEYQNVTISRYFIRTYQPTSMRGPRQSFAKTGCVDRESLLRSMSLPSNSTTPPIFSSGTAIPVWIDS
jgi:hypothetical protein